MQACSLNLWMFLPVFRIHDIWGGSGSSDPCFWLMDPDPEPGSGSCYFRHWPSTCQQKPNFNTIFSAYYFLKVHLHHFSKIKSKKNHKILYSGRTKYSACASKLSKLSREYLCPQKTQKAAVFFFLFERSSAEEWIKILTDVKILKKLLHKMSLNWHTKKIYILRGKMPTKSLRKVILRKKNWRDLLLDIINW